MSCPIKVMGEYPVCPNILFWENNCKGVKRILPCSIMNSAIFLLPLSYSIRVKTSTGVFHFRGMNLQETCGEVRKTIKRRVFHEYQNMLESPSKFERLYNFDF